MDTVEYDLEKFLESSDAIIANINKIKDDLSIISSKVASSSDHWTGRSHNSFVNSYNSIQSKYNNFLDKLELLASNLTTIHALYTTHEHNTSNIL